ncbi:glycine cleavage system protein H [Pseudomonas sp. ZM23]|uniref:Glycine cleavage system protein H n=1 Tax=Pseudomonas triclosanedens TaxID=2961893 RepID=A0ABY6ZVU4_9PSED|nr:glycine cleavage system protein H [Pseudomonas triclosanedens]MCP8465332.1 glycine cleavage system protein H [Pseudomonas triclosanedens]MCP8470728.1 glycine cleavage system protein H [Pseudomonas triclosanedens]MCP8476631.1 glycine cleavage system protein H [Pseudomonas triclosanedens]WAI48914.1 glycine cleavage system protein H [Pseudomonas triclosanedens]
MKLHGLEFPDGLLYAPEYNLWLREEPGGAVTLGLTAYGCALYGQIFAFTPKRDGWHIDADRSFGVVEFAKAASSARSPLAGDILASNEAVVRRPGLINQDCYGEGWMVRMKPDDWAAVRDRFLQGRQALDAFAQRMYLDNFDPDDDGVQALRP